MPDPVTRDLRLLAYELGQAFAARRELPELIAFAIARCRELLGAEGVAILLLDRENDELYIPYAAEEDPHVATQLTQVHLPAYRGIAGKVLRTARALRVDDTSTDRWFFGGVDDQTRRATRSLVCAPLIAARGALGVIEAVNPRSGGRFTDEDLALLEALAQTLAGAIDSTSPPATARGSHPHAAVTDAKDTARDHTFHQQGEYWTIVYDGTTVRLKHVKGLSYIAHLLRSPGEEVHALDLVNTAGGEPEEPQEPLRDPALSQAHRLGDAGALLDPQAKADYKRRLGDLRQELEEARGLNDRGRAEHVQREVDFLTRELARAVGLGGRDRRAGSHAERARVNVTRAIAAALEKIAEHHPELGRHFAATIKTGTFCSYRPDPRVPVMWVL